MNNPWHNPFTGVLDPFGNPLGALTLPEDSLVEAVVGWRKWNVPLFGDEIRSLNGAVWPVCQRFRAICANGVCAGLSCGCGIYAFKHRSFVDYLVASTTLTKTLNLAAIVQPINRYCEVIGQVSLWGRILQCTDGYRAQFAYPKSLINTGPLAKRMAEVYRVALIE